MFMPDDEIRLLRRLSGADEVTIYKRREESAAASLDAKGFALWRPYRQRGSSMRGFACITAAGLTELNVTTEGDLI